MTFEFNKVHSFRCSCNELVVLRFIIRRGDILHYIELWHKDQFRMDGDYKFSMEMVGRHLRVLLQDSGCDAASWFKAMGYKED